MDIEVAQQLIALAAAAVTALVGLGVFGLKSFAKKVNNEWARAVLERGAEAAQRAYLEVEQVFVAEARDRDGDGKLGPKERRVAAAMAASRAKSYAGPKGLKELAKVLGAEKLVDSFFSSSIEANVAAAKKLTPKK